MEYWNDGFGIRNMILVLKTQYSTIPSFHDVGRNQMLRCYVTRSLQTEN
jgi:hypothetical protein